ncbi:hypothetical protein SSPS47_00300 [Streptomyces sp. S4.7]|uniref:hypothetical protein n=1 Tax=Streptomyces sp. S4.7 TaxID=2705439 RepID=UPI001398D4CA|nr:hypothetical protein [Streptomyces sp. S4.7]QHY93570.1 hypothetical protein SSPS47_00300 [Streptomyces sp. S4.7]
MTRRRGKTPLFEQGCIPAPGGLLDWRDARHVDAGRTLPCVLCGSRTPMRSHYGEPVHKACADSWITGNAAEARLGRFASDIQPETRDKADDHA